MKWGVSHIAKNHGFKCETSYEEDGSMAIYGINVPTLSDVRMMCEDLGFPTSWIYTSEIFGYIEIDIEDWFEGEEEYLPTGHEMWKKTCEDICC